MKKITLFLFLTLNFCSSIFSQCISYDVHACIDVIDQLHVQGTQMWWVHQGGSNPGQHSSCSGDVLSVNGVPWGAWNTPYILSGATACMNVTSTVTTCSNACYLVQAPSPSNGWETIYSFDDSGPSAAHYYNINFTFCPATPTSTFTASSPACSGNNVTITYTGTGSSTAVYNWNFDGGTIISGSGQGPYIINWAAAGTYNVTLDVTDCSSTSTVTTVPVVVIQNPTSIFTVSTPVCEAANATITYSGSGSTNDTYNWNFDSGNIVSGSGQGPYIVNWAAAGIKNVTLNVDASGCLSAPASIPLTVIAPPTSLFIASAPVCPGVNATITYTGNASANANYSWGFDGGTVASGSGQGPYSVNWPTAGTHNLTLTVTENSCPSIVTTIQQIIEPQPIADFSSTDRCLNQAMNFNDLSTGTITGRSWNFGDASPLNTLPNPGYTYTLPGTYQVFLIATDNNGCKDTVTKNVIVHPLPDALFSATNVCEGEIIQFTNLSVVANPDNIQSLQWNFGDGSPLNNLPNASHLYAGAGIRTVQLLAVSSFGCKDSINRALVVNPTPFVHFTSDDTVGCGPLCCNFQSSSTIATGINTSYSWNFGDGGTGGTNSSLNHCFTNNSASAAITYTISLMVTSDSGCVSTLTKNNYITVFPTPAASCTATEYDIIERSSTQLSASGGGSYKWVPSTGINCDTCQNTFASPTHTITYCVLVTNLDACTDSTCLTINVEKYCPSEFEIPNAFSPNNDGHNDAFCLQGWSDCVKEFNIIIFDRWGAMVFESTDPTFCWDGTAPLLGIGADKPMGPAAFVYSVKATTLNGKQITKKGNISLIR